jgi:hypothetical protein
MSEVADLIYIQLSYEISYLLPRSSGQTTDAACSSVTLVPIYQTTRRHVPESALLSEILFSLPWAFLLGTSWLHSGRTWYKIAYNKEAILSGLCDCIHNLTNKGQKCELSYHCYGSDPTSQLWGHQIICKPITVLKSNHEGLQVIRLKVTVAFVCADTSKGVWGKSDDLGRPKSWSE